MYVGAIVRSCNGGGERPFLTPCYAWVAGGVRGMGIHLSDTRSTDHLVSEASDGRTAPGRRRLGRLISFADRHRYLLASSVLVVLMSSQTLNQQWSSDFWEHSAVVREFSTHLLHPHHPLLLVDATHPYFSPYTLAVGMLARLVGIGPLGALSVAAILNLLFFLIAFRLFVTRLVTSPLAPFYALVFTLVLWGLAPWRWSGFLNLNSIGFGLPYPSMFAIAVGLLSLWALDVYLKGHRLVWLLVTVVSGAVVVLTHPITAITVAVGGAALVVSRLDRRSWRLLAPLLGAAVLVLVLVLAWPYYSLLDLLSQSSIYTVSHDAMYQGILQRIFPALFAVPLIAQRVRANRRDPLALMLAGGFAVFVWGGLSGNLTYGRILSFLVLLLHIALAGWFADLEQRVRHGSDRASAAAAAYGGLALLLIIGVVGVSPGLLRTIPSSLLPESLRSDARLGKVSDRYGFLGDCTGQYDVILTDLGFSSLAVPTFGGKVVSTGYPIPFVGDKATRDEDVERFFRPNATTTDRLAILAKYHVSYLLVEQAQLDSLRIAAGTWDYLSRLVAEHDGLVLVAVGTAPKAQCRA